MIPHNTNRCARGHRPASSPEIFSIHADGTQAIPKRTKPPFRYVQLLSATAVAANSGRARTLFVGAGASTDEVWFLRLGIRDHAGTRSLAGERAEQAILATALKAIKRSVARRLAAPGGHFWQARYYDFNVRTAAKRIEKLKYMHRNPVKRGLVKKPADWQWSSYHPYLTGEEGIVEIESPWSVWIRESSGDRVRLQVPSS